MLVPRWIHESGAERLAAFELDWPLTNSNAGQGRRWYGSKDARKHLGVMVHAIHGPRVPFDQRVVLVIARILAKGEQKWDSDSIGRGNAKQLIDAMVASGWFHDDSNRWISHVAYCQWDRRPRGLRGSIGVQVFADCYEELVPE